MKIFFSFIILLTSFILLNISNYDSIKAQSYEMINVPVRWCAVEGTPAVEEPYFSNPYGEVDTTTENILDTRLKMINDNIYNPIGISFYSLHSDLPKPINSIPVIEDPFIKSGNPGNRTINIQAEGGIMLSRCNLAWQEKLQNNSLDGIIALNIRLFIHPNGTATDIFGSGCCSNPGIMSYVFVSDNKFTSSTMEGGEGWNIDELDKTLGHEIGHALGLSDVTNNPDALMFNNLKRPDGTVSGIELIEREISTMRNNALLIPGATTQT